MSCSTRCRLRVGGKIAQLGQRLIDGAAKSMAEDFFARFEALMQQRQTLASSPKTKAVQKSWIHRSWEHDAASTSYAPLDATPSAPPRESSGIPVWGLGPWGCHRAGRALAADPLTSA